MKNLVDHLSQYASYHRDSRNIVTHFIGIPLIVLRWPYFCPGRAGQWAASGYRPRQW